MKTSTKLTGFVNSNKKFVVSDMDGECKRFPKALDGDFVKVIYDLLGGQENYNDNTDPVNRAMGDTFKITIEKL